MARGYNSEEQCVEFTGLLLQRLLSLLYCPLAVLSIALEWSQLPQFPSLSVRKRPNLLSQAQSEIIQVKRLTRSKCGIDMVQTVCIC